MTGDGWRLVDSLLAEGKPWWITANSDSHQVYADIAVRGGGDFNANGRYNDPVYGGGSLATTNSDFWPGFYSRTHVGSRDFSYASVMAGLRAGQVWVDHGALISGIDVRVRSGNSWVTLGDTLVARRGARVELSITVDLATRTELGPGRAGARSGRRDPRRGHRPGREPGYLHTAPDTKVVKSFEVGVSRGLVTSPTTLVRWTIRSTYGCAARTETVRPLVSLERRSTRPARRWTWSGTPIRDRPVVLHQPIWVLPSR